MVICQLIRVQLMTWTGVKAAKAGLGGAAARSEKTGYEASGKTGEKEGGPGLLGKIRICQWRYVN